MRVSVIILLVLLGFPLSVFAHHEAVDGDMRVVMHVDPLDRPAAAAPATFSFEFKDNLHQFQPQYCNCVLALYQGNKLVYSTRLFEQEAVSYTFTEAGNYSALLTGNPKIDGEFQPFSVTYDLPVAQQLSWIQQIWIFFANFVAKIGQH